MRCSALRRHAQRRTCSVSAALLALPSLAVSPGALALCVRRAIAEVKAEAGAARTRHRLAHIRTCVVEIA